MSGYSARVKLPPGLAGLTRDQLAEAIYQTALSAADDKIARLRIVEKWRLIDIAEDLKWSEAAVSRRYSMIEPAVERMAVALCK